MFDEAQHYIVKAGNQQKIGNFEGAFDSYQTALTGLLDLYRIEEDSKRKIELGELVEVSVK